MPTDNQYDEILDKLADTHQQRLADALVTLEERVAGVMADAPLQGGKLFDTEWAINARPALKEAMDDAYLSEVDGIVRGYGSVASDAQDMLQTYGDFTKIDSATINQLQRLSFQGFESVANEYLDTLANEVYQSTLTGRSFNDTVKSLRQTINGVYIQSDDVEAQRLVDLVNNGTAAQAKDAAEQLRTKFARDRAGNNLRRYSTQMAQDSLMQFDASINTAIGIQSGATKWKYYGDVIRDSRPFCRKHAGQVFTEEEIADTWAGSWKGKSSGDPLIVRGGYNCRHHWRPVFDEENIVEKSPAPTLKFNEDETNVIGSVADLQVAVSVMNPKVLAVASKLPKPQTILHKDKAGLYDWDTNTLTAGFKDANGAVLRHEYGHHMDAELGKLLGSGRPFAGISDDDFEFTKAYRADKKALGLNPSDKNRYINARNLTDEIYDDVEKSGLRMGKHSIPEKFTYMGSKIKDPDLLAYSDILDAMTDGEVHDVLGKGGHGKDYYKKHKSLKTKETFANLTALRGTDYWDMVERDFPRLAKRYDEIIDEALELSTF